MPPTKNIAVVLSGCGYLDGSEITEAVSTLIALSESGAQYSCFAPSIEIDAVDHLTRKSNGEKRNTLHESARIARSKVQDLKLLKESDFDAVVFPGGFGAAKNLSDWAQHGAKGKALPEIARVIRDFHQATKPIGAICIAPALIAQVLGKENVTLTIGNDRETAQEIEKTGAEHAICLVTDYVSDRDHKVLTSPAYMYDDAKPYDVFTGIRKMIRELVEMS